MTEIARDSFYKQRYYQISLTSWDDDENQKNERKRLKELSQNRLTMDIISDSLGNFGQTSAGPDYTFLSFICIDKTLCSLAGIDEYKHLQYIDVSHNMIITLKPLSQLKYLTYLNVSHNKLVKLLDLKEVPKALEEINFSFNEIEEITDLSQHRFLQQVILNNNKIKKIQGINDNKYLTYLDLAHNEIEEIENLEDLNLTYFNISWNQIQLITGLSQVPQLRILDLSGNQIEKLKGLIDLISLRELYISSNNIGRVREIRYIQNLAYLSVLDFCFNQIQSRRFYRLQVLYRLPGLRILDGVNTSSDEFVKAENLYGEDLQDRKSIFQSVLPEQEFIDRRINIMELIEPETDSENEDLDFIDQYNNQGEIVKSTTGMKSVRGSLGQPDNQFSATVKSVKSAGSVGFSNKRQFQSLHMDGVSNAISPQGEYTAKSSPKQFNSSQEF